MVGVSTIPSWRMRPKTSLAIEGLTTMMSRAGLKMRIANSRPDMMRRRSLKMSPANRRLTRMMRRRKSWNSETGKTEVECGSTPLLIDFDG